jgi:hypothetical protein
MTMFKMLMEVICIKEFSSLITFTEFIGVSQMLNPGVLIIREF